MPTCRTCGYTWNWKEAMRLIYRAKACCPNCDANQYLSAKSRKRSSYTSMLVVIPLAITSIYRLSLWFYLSFSFALLIILLLLSPLYYQLSNEEEPLW
ncbi:TIGR04104 family putative zinc finger protein [Guptibacillus hwajinpoensis]|uniref:TIGR04104 family putative zinc finger protein n=1 Tax=Guptibacillus hwajinpoensis TaxID=208199 RepID=UPI0024B3B386|nr:TIGR04104 family putative zinc finger protein [Pseudalkalibacillus hwajinpoensis]